MTSTMTPAAGVTSPSAAGATEPDHGSLKWAMGDRRTGRPRCHCELCRAAERRYSKRRTYLASRGTPILVDAAPAREHVMKIRAAGDAFTVVAATYRIPRRTLTKLMAGEVKRLRCDTAAAVLALPIGSCPDGYASVPAVGSIRRVRALIAVGHSLNDIKAASGIQHATASLLLNDGVKTIRRSVADQVERGYLQLAVSRGSSQRSLNRAAREGWRDPLWWEDMGQIDDPDFDPDEADRVLNQRELAALRRDEIQHLASYGMSGEQIAGRLGMAVGTVLDLMRELRTGQRRNRGQEDAA